MTASNTTENTPAPLATLKDVAAYFRRPGETLSQFSAEWKELSDKDRTDLRTGIGDGTYNY